MVSEATSFFGFSPGKISRRDRRSIILIFVFLAVSITTYGLLQRQKIADDTSRLLHSVSSQKAEQISLWQSQHLIEADELVGDKDFGEYFRNLVRRNDKAAEVALKDRFERTAQAYGYSGTLLVRSDLSIAWASSDSLVLDQSVIPFFDLAAENARSVFTDIHLLAPEGEPGCNIIIPIFDPEAQGRALVGFVAHFIEADRGLFQIVRSWPVPSFTAENIIVKRDGSQVRFLSSPKFMPDSALSFAIPIEGSPTVETLAFLATGTNLAGKNYRGKNVFASVHEIKDTSWLLVSEIEWREVFRPWWSLSILLAAILAIGTAAAVLLGTALLHWRSAFSYRRQLESEVLLRSSERKFLAFMDHMPSMVLIKEANGTTIFVNRELNARFPGEDWIGKKPDEIWSPEQAAITMEGDAKALAEGYVEYEDKRLGRNGEEIHLLVQKFKMLGDGDQPLIGQIMTDVTERNRALRQVRELNNALEEKVRERTALLEASNAELHAFTYSVSHDLRSPLRSLDGFAELLAKEFSMELGERGYHYISRIRASTARMAELINDMLSLSKVSNLELNKTKVDIGRTADLIISEYIRKFTEKEVSISIKPSMMAFCDELLIDILFRTLIDNAFKFSSERGVVSIEVGSIPAHTPGSGGTVYFIRDNGVGFDMAYKDTLFQPFHRLHGVEDYPGNGIGLSIAKRIIDRHGGRIWLESEPGKGTTAFFTLG